MKKRIPSTRVNLHPSHPHLCILLYSNLFNQIKKVKLIISFDIIQYNWYDTIIWQHISIIEKHTLTIV